MKTNRLSYTLIAATFIVNGCSAFRSTSGPSAATLKNQERDLTCRLAFILSIEGLGYLMPDNRTDLSLSIKKYVDSDAYSAIKDATGREAFKEAFDAARQAKAALEVGGAANAYRAGQLTAAGSIAVVRACMFYRFPECEAFSGEHSVDIEKVHKAMMLLKACGATLWQFEAEGAGQSRSATVKSRQA